MLNVRRGGLAWLARCIFVAVYSSVASSILLCSSLALTPIFLLSPPEALAQGIDVVNEVEIRGNAKVESDAILSILKTRKGESFNPDLIKDDIVALYDLDYFSDVRVYKDVGAGGELKLIFEVKEKPAITAIEFRGMDEVSEDDLKDKLETKLYTILNENTINADIRVIEKEYAGKGFYLARVTYVLEKRGETEVTVIFNVEEGGKVQVGEVEILGNEYFTDNEIINESFGLASRPYSRSSAWGSSSLYQDELVRRDLEYLAQIYKDQGFAEVKVAKPLIYLDPDREFARITFQVEEGLQYSVGSIDVSGDLLFTKEELFEAMNLKPNELFRHSFFTRDIEMMVDKYGDLGYAYADVNPKVRFDRENRLAHINYEITKGEKVYFGDITITGNTKTRDNVIRREMEVADSELYSGTGLANSKRNITRLGFFEEVQIVRERDTKVDNRMNLGVKIKEKPTGQLQAAIGFSPSQGTTQQSWFGQGRYDEQNQSGKGWATNVTGKWNGEDNYSLETSFSDPRVNDSQWSAGVSAFLQNEVRRQFDEVEVEDRRIGGSVFIGRTVYELIRARISYKWQRITQDTDTFVLRRYIDEGIASSLIFTLFRRDVDNFIDPTEGSDVALQQQITGGKLLMGDQEFMESSADLKYFYPVDFTDTFRTYFKFHLNLAYIYPLGPDKPVPFSERYRLGGYNDLRGFDYWEIGPQFRILDAPGDVARSYNKGGNKRLYGQLEYFVPLIPQAGIKALIFTDVGRVYDDDEGLAWTGFYRDVGFGFRWITPIAPFRFEWAYPIEDGKLGDMEIIFYIGY